VMPVHHKIHFAHFVKHDGRKINFLIESAVDLLPTAGELSSLGRKARSNSW
jgi:hypothetical protein